MTYRYEYDGFDFTLVNDNGDVIDRMDEIGICFDKRDSVLLKHGQPERVHKYYQEIKEKIAPINEYEDEILFDICFISGKFPVEEINKCLDICDYVGTFYKKTMKGLIS